MSKASNKVYAHGLGHKVRWTSQAAGGYKIKEGSVVGVILAGEHARTVLRRSGRQALGDRYSDDLKIMGQTTSLIDRYLVAVERIGRSGKPTGKIDLYTPSASNVDRQMAMARR